jgi:hypothetical protein
VGGALLVPRGGEPAPVPPSVAEQPTATPAAASASAADLIRTLQGLLPDGKFSDEEGRGTNDSLLSPYAKVVYDDGKGVAAVAISLGRIEPGGNQARETTDCPDKALTPYDSCVSSRLSDGSLLKLFQGYEYPDRRVDTKLWSADLITPTGQHVSVSEWNSAAEKGAPISRPEPPLSTDQLKRMVTAEVWRGYVDAIPEDPRKPTATATPSSPAEPTVDSILNTLVPLLPKNVEVVDKGSDYSYVVVDDGRGKNLVQVDVQHGMSDVADELYGSGAETLADGTRVATLQGPGDKGVPGGAMWTADTMRTDGFRVVISAFNSGTQHDAPTRSAPALTLKQLRAIALSPRWLELR